MYVKLDTPGRMGLLNKRPRYVADYREVSTPRSRLKSPITDAAVKVYQLISMSLRDFMILYSLSAYTKSTGNGQGRWQ
jgi:hypothetical protein